MTEFQVSGYRTEFRQAALSLLRAFFQEEGLEVPALLLEARFDHFAADDRNAVLLAIAGGEVLGIVTLTTSFGLEFGLSAELEDLYVVPEARGRGIAGRLLDAALAWCRARRVQAVYLVVLPQDAAAGRLLPFYANRGFVDEGRRLLFFDGDLTDPGPET